MNKRTQQPLDPRCYNCVVTTSKAWPSLEWPNIVAKSRSDAQFKSLVQAAIAVYTGRAEKNFHPEQVCDVSSQMIVVERKFLFLSEDEFTSHFGVRPAQVPEVRLESHVNEQGQEVQGVVCLDPAKTVSQAESGSHHEG